MPVTHQQNVDQALAKMRAWRTLAESPGRPPAVNREALDAVKIALAHDAEFWSDILDRHGLRDKALDELDTAIREHAIGNFWGMVAQTAHQLGFKI